MAIAILVLAVLPALLAAAAVFDLMTYKIPNAIPGAMILLFLGFVLLLAPGGGLSLSDTGLHLLAGAVGLLAGMALFAAGWVGGGDAKLFAATVLWLGWEALLDYAIVASLAGGGLTLALLTLRELPLPAVLMRQAWFARLSDPKGAVPYGVALSLAALVVLPDTQVFQIASRS